MQEIIEQAVKALDEGKLVAIPTETVYGLAADADNKEAVMRIYAAKNRPTNHPLIVHVANSEAIKFWAREIPEDVKKLTDAFWPGPLTLILKRSERAKDFVTGDQDSVALRCPSHPLTHALLEAFDRGQGKGLTAPSANTFGKISPTTAEHVREDLGSKVDLIIDGGPCTVGIESTMLDLSQGEPRILREGAVTAQMISKVINKEVFHGKKESSPRVSGSLKSHYAPEHTMELLDELDMIRRAQFLARSFKTFALIAPSKISKRFERLAVKSFGYDNPEELQTNLYSWMHELDKSGADRILVVPPAYDETTAGVLDRLSRAATPKDK